MHAHQPYRDRGPAEPDAPGPWHGSVGPITQPDELRPIETFAQLLLSPSGATAWGQ